MKGVMIMEQVLGSRPSVPANTDDKEHDIPIITENSVHIPKRGFSGVVFMQTGLVLLLLIAAVTVNIADRDFLSGLKDEFIRLTNKDTEQLFYSIIDYIQSFIRT